MFSNKQTLLNQANKNIQQIRIKLAATPTV
jgi:hypothetical protein